MVTEKEIREIFANGGGGGGGSKDIEIAELFNIYDDRVIIEDFSTIKIGNNLVKCELFIKAKKQLSSSMSSILSTTEKVIGFDWINGNNLTWNSSTKTVNKGNIGLDIDNGFYSELLLKISEV